MPENMKEELQSTLTPLVTGILEDTQKLIRQEIALVKSELKRELINTKATALSLMAGIGFSLTSMIFLFLTLAHLLQWVFPSLYLWECYGCIALLSGIMAFFLFLHFSQAISSVRPAKKANSVSPSMVEQTQ